MEKIYTRVIILLLICSFISCTHSEINLSGKSVWNGITEDDEYFELEVVIFKDTIASYIRIFNGPPQIWMTSEYQAFIKTKCLDQGVCNFKFDLMSKNYGNFTISNGKKNIALHHVQNFIDSDSVSYLMSEYLFRYRRYLCMGQDSFKFNVESSNINKSEEIKAVFNNK